MIQTPTGRRRFLLWSGAAVAGGGLAGCTGIPQASRPPGSTSLHLGHAGTVTALPAIVRGLASRGLRPVTLTELLSP